MCLLASEAASNFVKETNNYDGVSNPNTTVNNDFEDDPY